MNQDLEWNSDQQGIIRWRTLERLDFVKKERYFHLSSFGVWGMKDIEKVGDQVGIGNIYIQKKVFYYYYYLFILF